ncbi:MAG: DNA-deoxyinosine glycosylase [Betaproteobacteria bacterium HGW-Betaproteobacteria-10]|nr:MAG: DNA-deoxyinosine glycosylase [Betaproteobacteria bacterium HGW-Betaproteobacteria-10]
MALIYGFPPLANGESRLLILGSMPGRASLQAARYYAHERNVFWRIMGDLFGAGPALDYPQRSEKLQAAGVALWDVMAACERAGSLDSDIVGKSVQVNDFSAFLAVNRKIRHIFFNGAAAEASFRRHVLPLLAGPPLHLMRLPSTSPAHAALAYAEKLAAWSVIVALPNK